MIDQHLEEIKEILAQERELHQINSLEQRASSQARRERIKEHMSQIDAELAPIRQEIEALPALTNIEVSLWAQSILKMQSAAVLELDTTGLGQDAEICRVTLTTTSGELIADVLIKPANGIIPQEVSEKNGIIPEQIADAHDLASVWPYIAELLEGRYIVSFAQEWDREQLTKAAHRHNLQPIPIIGEDLQRQLTKYYNREYYLKLLDMAERMTGTRFHDPVTSIERCQATCAILTGLALGISDVRPPRQRKAETQTTAATVSSSADGNDDELGSLDDHPF